FKRRRKVTFPEKNSENTFGLAIEASCHAARKARSRRGKPQAPLLFIGMLMPGGTYITKTAAHFYHVLILILHIHSFLFHRAPIKTKKQKDKSIVLTRLKKAGFFNKQKRRNLQNRQNNEPS